MKLKPIATIGLVIIGAFLLMADDCDSNSGAQTSRSGATEVQNVFQVPKNSRGNTVEQQNIYDRLAVTTDPTKVMWIHLIALDGKIIRRMPVRNKVTSSGKRLEARHWTGNPANVSTPPQSGGNYTDELIQPDGTFGESDAYIYWFDPQHRYHQYGTAGGIGYLLTDYPIDLSNPMDAVTGMYNVQKEALAWQQEQEKQLREQEAQNKR